MSWHYSRALVEEYSGASSQDGAQSAQSRLTTTAAGFFYSGKMTASFRPSRYGTTSEPLMDDLGEGLLTWFQGDFPVRTYHAQAKEQESKEADRGYGQKWHELSARYDPNTHSWKTHRSLFQEDLQPYSVTLPRWGMMQDGVLYQHPTLERPIGGIESGWLPTPCTVDSGSMFNRSASSGAALRPTLGAMAKHNMWPTPRTRDWTGSGKDCLDKAVGGQLNPPWVEWLMGWPTGWTDLKPLAMDKFREWLQQHGEF